MNDTKIDIATGRSRKETSWKNKQMTWGELVGRLRATHHTSETHAEYMAAKKQRQDEIKDQGGYVGGFLTGGRRKAGSVLHRQLITLDVDYAKQGFWDDLQLMYGGTTALVYSTHKHSPEHPRLRLVMPLDRAVRPDEYEAIARRIAGNLDIELFDPTTFQPERLMYWPSTSKDSVYYLDTSDGEWLSADEILGSYTGGWEDSSQWPVSEKVDKILQRSILKQGDPLEKSGVVGAFCRTYDIHDVIEAFLTDEYEACDTENRYSYKHGSTGAGLVVYEDKYAYSHHGTDPISGKLCNAFDLVRIHKFGLKDEDAKDGIPIVKTPSFLAMMEFCIKDKKVIRQLGNERLSEAKDDFEDLNGDDGLVENEIEVAEEELGEWVESLKIDTKGKYLSTISNVELILIHDPRLMGCFMTDEFARKKVIVKNLPWRRVTKDTRELVDEDEQDLIKYLEKKYDITNRSNIEVALSTHMRSHKFHPVKDYLNRLEWDGVHRVDNLFIEYLGAAKTNYIRQITRKSLVAAVARIYQPGIKFDYVPTLVGEEGQGKSEILAKLGKEWFSDSFSFHMLKNNQAFEAVQGVWIMEFAELTGHSKTDNAAIKHFISKREDSFRKAFGKNKETFKRQGVFFGTSNPVNFLRDPDGNRRFWPIEILINKPTKDIFEDLTDSEIDQVWAEAIMFYKKKETLYLSKDMEQVAKGIQFDHMEVDDRVGMVERYLDTLLPDTWDELDVYQRRAFIKGSDITAVGTIQRMKVCAGDIHCDVFDGSDKDINRNSTKSIHDMMRKMKGWQGYKGKTTFGRFGMQKGYYRTSTSPTSAFHELDKNTNSRKN